MGQLNDLLVLGKATIKGSIKANNDHDLICHSNEFTFASPGYSGDIYVNYRTASGSSDGAITGYRFYKGDGTNLANIVAAGYSGTSISGTSLSIINDASNTSYDALAYFRNRGDSDWTVKVDSEGYNYGLLVTNLHTATYAFQVTGGSRFSNTLRIGNGTNALDGNYCEGIRIRTPDSQWATIILGATADTGTNANAWSIHRKSDNNFCISRNSSDGSNGLVMTSTGMGLGTTSPSYRLHVIGDIYANGGWLRVSSTNGLYFQSYGGGWHMTDETYIRAYNGKMVYASGRYLSETVPSSWLDGQRYNNGGYNVNDYSNDGSYNPWMRAKNTHANVKKYFSFGTLGKLFYWIGSTTDRTENGYDKGMNFNVESGLLYAPIVTGDRIYTGYDSGQPGSVSCSNWFRCNGATGLYNASYGTHLMPNTVSNYGGWRISGTNSVGGYHGILIGDATTSMTVMSIDNSHQGLYTQSGTGWIVYNDNASQRIGIGTSTTNNRYKVTLSGNTYNSGNFMSSGIIYHDGEASGRRIITGSVRNAGMKYDYNGNECLIISSGTYAESSIQFFTANKLSMNDSNGQWNASIGSGTFVPPSSNANIGMHIE